MAEDQKISLEETVKERTSELEEKSTALEGVSNQLAKYIPPQIHDALFAGKYDTEIKTQRRKLTVFLVTLELHYIRELAARRFNKVLE